MAAPVLHTMENALIECGVNNDNALSFNRETAAQQISSEVFDSDLISCIDTTSQYRTQE